MTDQVDVPKIHRLAVKPNNYPWGEIGIDSLAAKMTKNASAPGFEIEPQEPYSELWMSTHPTLPATLYPHTGEDKLLSTFLKANPTLLGAAAKKFPPPFTGKKGSGTENQTEGHVPFLFKILTCKQALPLQIHPDKGLAKKLLEEDPEKYPDVNHKPEIAVTLSETFTGFASFRPYEQIVAFLTSVPELKDLPSEVKDKIKFFVSSPIAETLQPVWEAFLNLSDDEKVVKAFTRRVGDEAADAFKDLKGDIDHEEKLRLVKAVKSAGKYYHGDGGLFSALFFLNLVELKKGEGMYVGADGAHAWLEGEIVELMAISDNVLNVGFTPESEKDSTALVAKSVTYTPKSIPDLILKSQPFSKSTTGKTTVYSTPFEEFSILRVEGDEQLQAFDGPGIAIVLEGEWTIADAAAVKGGEAEAVEGSVWFIGAGAEASFKSKESGGTVWMAFYDGDAKEGEVGEK